MPKGITITEKQFNDIKKFWKSNPQATYAQATQKFKTGYKTLNAVKKSKTYASYLKNFVPRAYKAYKDEAPQTRATRVEVKHKKSLWEKIKEFFS